MMKLRFTTPVSKGFATRITLVAIALLFTVTASMSVAPEVFADPYDDQINALQKQASLFQSQANEYRKKADTLANKLQQITSEKAGVQTQVDLSQAQYDKLQQQIIETTQKIKDNQDALGTTIADLYIDDAISPLEMLASSNNIGDYVDKQTYRSSVRDTLTQTIDTIKTLKNKLEADKVTIKEVLDKQTVQRNSLAALEAEQQRILTQTRGEEAAYQQQAANARSQLESVAAQQRAYYQSLLRSGGGNAGVVGSFQYANWSGNQGCGGDGYRFCGVQDSYADDWNLYNRECVSYVAWALAERFNRDVQPFHGDGNAYEWTTSAPRWSQAVRVGSPQPGDAVILPQSGSFAPIGHAMIVESVSGEWIRVSQYNFYGTGEYSTMDIKNSGVALLRFPSK